MLIYHDSVSCVQNHLFHPFVCMWVIFMMIDLCDGGPMGWWTADITAPVILCFFTFFPVNVSENLPERTTEMQY